MSLRFGDSVETYTTSAQMLRKWDVVTTFALNDIGAAKGSRGRSTLALTSTRHYEKNFTSKQTWIVGFRYEITTFPSVDSNIIQLVDSAGPTAQIGLLLKNDGSLVIHRGSSVGGVAGTVLATGSRKVELNRNSYIELKVLIDNTVGTYELRMDGVNIASGIGADTQTSANATADRVHFGNFASVGPSSGGCDFYVCDGDGSVNNTFLGDIVVTARMPSANGANTGLTTSTGVNHAALVDDNPANDDTDYCESATPGAKDTYDCAALTGTFLAIHGVQINMVARKDDAGARTICSVTRSGGADFDGASKTPSTNYAQHMEIVELDPNTAAAWANAAAVDAAEFGMKVLT